MELVNSTDVLIRGGSLLTPHPSCGFERADILIREGTIVRISQRIERRDARPVDATGMTVIPGLINLHAHITRRHLHLQRSDLPFRQGASVVENLPDETRILWGLRNAWTELAEGVTTVRDAGSKHHVSIRLRDAFEDGIFRGPQILACGEPVAITGGHESHRYAGAREADGPSEVRKAVREQLRNGADWVKLMASAGIGGMPKREHPVFTEFAPDELAAGVVEAHKRGRKAMAHAMSDESVQFCVQAGIDSIEHGVLMSPRTVGMLREAGVALVPTLSGIRNVHARERAAGNTVFADQLLHEVLEPHKKAVAVAIESGVLVGTGSDTLGSVAEEIRLLVDCGMSMEQAFAAATIDSARILGLEDQIGSIEEGKRADLTIVEGNPLEDVHAFARIREVIFAGNVLSRMWPEALAGPPALR